MVSTWFTLSDMVSSIRVHKSLWRSWKKYKYLVADWIRTHITWDLHHSDTYHLGSSPFGHISPGIFTILTHITWDLYHSDRHISPGISTIRTHITWDLHHFALLCLRVVRHLNLLRRPLLRDFSHLENLVYILSKNF